MEIINGQIFKDMLASGANLLTNKFSEIDALNVFPVPDGDTGTNMSLTFNAGVKEALACTSDDVCEIAKVLSKRIIDGGHVVTQVLSHHRFSVVCIRVLMVCVRSMVSSLPMRL